MLGTDADDSFTVMSANEVIFGGSSDDVLFGAQGADTYKLSSGNDVIGSFSLTSNDGISFSNGMELSFKQVGDGLLLTADGIHVTLLDVDKEEFLAADVIEFI
ncbi:hypothetical protein [Prochlorococcus marinus]|uniref:Uncharacterized protein n=1 Tax=Prochlorococcus marinus (strain MIT 9303) TaxID=59922 RepID=A2C653_PROM3|nr:hypothetical protein [Prochlorococcus marinus]ABM76963.1 Hypothetical protein P9303_02081 [Prochlorococcus marinus str. MIT 9303]